MFSLRVIVILLLIHGVNLARTPRFKDYRVPTWHGKNVKLWLRSYNERRFLTQLTTAAKEPPDFAGHYKIAGWGCGSVCASGALIDLKTGAIRPLPFAGHGRGDEYWIFTGGPIDGKYIESQRDSRLLIIRQVESGITTTWVTVSNYFVWDGKRFKKIKQVADGLIKK